MAQQKQKPTLDQHVVCQSARDDLHLPRAPVDGGVASLFNLVFTWNSKGGALRDAFWRARLPNVMKLIARHLQSSTPRVTVADNSALVRPPRSPSLYLTATASRRLLSEVSFPDPLALPSFSLSPAQPSLLQFTMSTRLTASPVVVWYSPKATRFAHDSGGHRPSRKLRPCLVTKVCGDWIRVAPLLSARPDSQVYRISTDPSFLPSNGCTAKMTASSWSIVNFGEHGPAPPVHPLPGATVFDLPLLKRPDSWRPTPCFVWTRDGGMWIDIAELGIGKARVLDGDFDFDGDKVTELREKHKSIVVWH
ncbi:uncharacterized protein C8Q71DRAFT_854402 [Rhodofomes roseus]|uniref:Uncharacterized protein n=1 Tax=Rhodofomes roseus TaxID=34475 RepID=A0ABQ8KTH5_9APHY|nr:uncharacterized protein C8Q71DRAFT_854366 [Rhodofomes roseus]XP_047783345.1 uncharacterized protein C8Q71DRAFT_854402 [Rhodofomes roseus]KAH9842012.1 hypothetical protein C8Q71DRAFT_854366 [Rhodofomes roseus]KAH9842046.1 hypothetical protein C8Q71DRAFT_854402 [Rhodofomes roseus]